MSSAYCFDCLERIDNCVCDNPSNRQIFGECRIYVANLLKEMAKRFPETQDAVNTMLDELS